MTTPTFSDEFRSDLELLFRWRRDVRRFEQRPVDPMLLQRLIDVTATAPSVGFSQPARFVQVSDIKRREAIIREYEDCNREALATYSGSQAELYARLKLAGLREAPVHLAIFADQGTQRGKRLGRLQMPETLAYSVVAAVHTLWLAARAYGLGVGWVSILDPRRVCSILEVESDWLLIAYLCLGYPVEEHDDRELVRASWEETEAASTLLFNR